MRRRTPWTSSFRPTAPTRVSKRTTSETQSCKVAEHFVTSSLPRSCRNFFLLADRLAKQRFSDTTNLAQPKLHDDKHRSESLPSPEHSLRPYHYTGAVSKLKTIDPKDASSQDSGINLSFHDDERKKLRNSLERLIDNDDISQQRLTTRSLNSQK